MTITVSGVSRAGLTRLTGVTVSGGATGVEEQAVRADNAPANNQGAVFMNLTVVLPPPDDQCNIGRDDVGVGGGTG